MVHRPRDAGNRQGKRANHFRRRSAILPQVQEHQSQAAPDDRCTERRCLKPHSPRMQAQVTNYIETKITDRDTTYAGSIYIDIEYVRGKQVVTKRGLDVGRMPIMLRSSKCNLRDASAEEMVKMNECPLDPG